MRAVAAGVVLSSLVAGPSAWIDFLTIHSYSLVPGSPMAEVLFRRLGWSAVDYDAWAQRLHEDEVAFIPPVSGG